MMAGYLFFLQRLDYLKVVCGFLTFVSSNSTTLIEMTFFQIAKNSTPYKQMSPLENLEFSQYLQILLMKQIF